MDIECLFHLRFFVDLITIPEIQCFSFSEVETGSKPIKSLFEDGQLDLANSHYRGDTRTCIPLIESFRQRFNFPASNLFFDRIVQGNRVNALRAPSFRRCLATIPVSEHAEKQRTVYRRAFSLPPSAFTPAFEFLASYYLSFRLSSRTVKIPWYRVFNAVQIIELFCC